MTARNTAIDYDARHNTPEGPRVSPPVSGKALAIGDGFTAQSFRAKEVDAAMDPLVMVDHYVMTDSTFGEHPHAGLSAVSLLFEDSSGRFHNRDSLGNDFDLLPGDLYWLKAGSGAVHDEAPRPGSRIHGLQVFVNLPQRQRHDDPMSLQVRGDEMPVLTGEGYRVRIALGSSNGVAGVAAPNASMTILDGTVTGDGAFVHRLAADRNAWVQAIDGDLSLSVAGSLYVIRDGEAMTVSSPAAGQPLDLQLKSTHGGAAPFALFAAEPIREPYVQQGPFVMGSAEEIDEVKAAHEAGRLGAL